MHRYIAKWVGTKNLSILQLLHIPRRESCRKFLWTIGVNWNYHLRFQHFKQLVHTFHITMPTGMDMNIILTNSLSQSLVISRTFWIIHIALPHREINFSSLAWHLL